MYLYRVHCKEPTTTLNKENDKQKLKNCNSSIIMQLCFCCFSEVLWSVSNDTSCILLNNMLKYLGLTCISEIAHIISAAMDTFAMGCCA